MVETTAREVLRALWRESIEAKEERVACIAGRMESDAFHVTKAQAVPTELADSLRVSPGPSLDRCGPPEWLGTVHTHIATFRRHLFGGQVPQLSRFNATTTTSAQPTPYATLSQSDRAVMGLWRLRWEAEGVFCVLYSPSEAYCEYGRTVNGDTFYADDTDTAASSSENRSKL